MVDNPDVLPIFIPTAYFIVLSIFYCKNECLIPSRVRVADRLSACQLMFCSSVTISGVTPYPQSTTGLGLPTHHPSIADSCFSLHFIIYPPTLSAHPTVIGTFLLVWFPFSLFMLFRTPLPLLLLFHGNELSYSVPVSRFGISKQWIEQFSVP